MNLDKETVKQVRGLIIFAVVAVVAGVNYQKLLLVIGTFFGILAPFLIGGVIAFILNVPMDFLERKINQKKRYKWSRVAAMLGAILLVITVLVVVTVLVVPELGETLQNLKQSLPAFFEKIQNGAEQLFADHPDIVIAISDIQIDWDGLMKQAVAFVTNGAGNVLSGTLSAAMSIVNGIACFGIGFVFSIYILLQKEVLGRQCRNLLKAFLPEKLEKKVLSVATLTSRIFSSFLTGQCLEAIILGLMFFVTLTLLRMDYAVLLGVLIGFTALIPVVGSFIGCAVGAFLFLIVNPIQAVIFLVLFIVLQQIEGNFIYPHVVGNSVGLPSIWVLVAVTLGGSTMGIVGILIFIPLLSVCYTLLREEVHRRIKEKKRTKEKKRD